MGSLPVRGLGRASQEGQLKLALLASPYPLIGIWFRVGLGVYQASPTRLAQPVTSDHAQRTNRGQCY